MQQLTGLDASFLALETANTTGHVGGVCVLDPSEAPRPLTLARLTDVLGERLPLVPVLRRKLLNVPLGLDQPCWVDDGDFDIGYHIREIALPRPGSDAQLTEQVARLHARPLDWSRHAQHGAGRHGHQPGHHGHPGPAARPGPGPPRARAA
jgi:diacylglycerol O-acyltransferase / wax synthase